MTKPEADKMYEFVIKYPRQAAFKIMELEAEVKKLKQVNKTR